MSKMGYSGDNPKPHLGETKTPKSGMSKMGYNGDAAALFKSLDADRSGELSLEAFPPPKKGFL